MVTPPPFRESHMPDPSLTDRRATWRTRLGGPAHVAFLGTAGAIFLWESGTETFLALATLFAAAALVMFCSAYLAGRRRDRAGWMLATATSGLVIVLQVLVDTHVLPGETDDLIAWPDLQDSLCLLIAGATTVVGMWRFSAGFDC